MEVAYIVLIILSGFIIINLNKKTLSKNNIKYLYWLWIFHLMTSLYYYYYIITNGGDAMYYWQSSQFSVKNIEEISMSYLDNGSSFIIFLNRPFAGVLEMGFLSNTLLFGLFGFIGLLLFYRITLDIVPKNSSLGKITLFPLLFFLPNLHFWSSGIGKDTLIFLSVALVSYGFLNIVKRFPLIIAGIVMIFFIRPHVALLLCVCFGFAYALNKKISKKQRFFLSFFLISFSLLILPSVLKYINMENASIESLDNFSTNRAGLLVKSSSGVNINSYPYILKVLTFLYRPFFFDINGIPALETSFENLLLLLLSIKLIRSKPFKSFKKAPVVIQGLLLFLIMGALIFSMSMSNLGIILRQRNMFLPGMILFILWSLSYKQNYSLTEK